MPLSKPDLSTLARIIRKDRDETLEAVHFLSGMMFRSRRRRRKSKASPKRSRPRNSSHARKAVQSAAVKD